MLSPTRILERLSQRLDLLKGGRDTGARQQTLRATIEWSHDLLSGEEQRLFARLAAFAGGCSLDAAEQVVDADLDSLQSLVEKSLVRHTNDRYWMLETIRGYAAERLEALPEARDLRTRLTGWYAAFAEVRERDIRAEKEEALGRLADEQANLRAALEWARAGGDQTGLVRIAGALGVFWFLRAELDEGRRWLTEALSYPEATPTDRGRLLPALVMVQLWQGCLDEAAGSTEQLLAVCDELDPQGRADALHVADVCYSTLGEPSRASELYEESAAVSRQAGNAWLLRQTLNNLGEAARSTGDLDAAERYFEEAISIAGHGSDGGQIGAIAAKVNLGAVAAARGDLLASREILRGAVELIRHHGHPEPGVVAPALINLAAILVQDRDPETGWILLAAADGFLETVGMAVLYSPDQLVREQARERGASELDDAERATLAAEGRALGLDAALDLALQRLGEKSTTSPTG